MKLNEVAAPRIRDVVDAKAAIQKSVEAMGGQELEKLYNLLNPSAQIRYTGRGMFAPVQAAEPGFEAQGL